MRRQSSLLTLRAPRLDEQDGVSRANQAGLLLTGASLVGGRSSVVENLRSTRWGSVSPVAQKSIQ